MAGKRGSRITISTEDRAMSKCARLGIDLARDMPEPDHSRSNANKSKPPKAIRLGIVLAHKLFRRPHDEHSKSPDRMDRIFYVHATHEQEDMQRRTAPSDPRRPIKLDISAPLTSPPAPSSKLMDKNSERQAAYNQSLTRPRRPFNAAQVKRWSLRSWRTQSGRLPTPEPVLVRPDDNLEYVKTFPAAPEKRLVGLHDHKRSESEPTPHSRPVRANGTNRFSERSPVSSQRGVMSLRIHKKASYESVSPSERLGIIEDPLEPVPRSSIKRGLSFTDQRWGPAPSPKLLGAIEELQTPLSPVLSPVRPIHGRPGSSFSIPRQHTPGSQVPKKAASTGMLRPQVATDNHLTVPARPGMPATIEQFDQRHIHPALRSPPTTSPTFSLFPATTTTTTPEIVPRPIPQVRIIPPSTVLDPDDFNTAQAERAIQASRPPLLREQLTLLKSMNATRATVCIGPLDLHPLLSNRAQGYVSLQLPPLPPPKPTVPGHQLKFSITTPQTRSRGTKIENVEFRSPNGASAIRLISPPGLGALACGELWASGKYKRHKTVKTGFAPANHRFTLLPGFEMTEPSRESVSSMNSSGHKTMSWCSCAEYDAWVEVTNARWKSVGIGRAEDGRWVVEFWEPMGSRLRSL